MRRNCLALILLFVNCVLLSNLGCQSSEQKLEAALKAQLTPILTFEKVVHDLGEVGPEQKKTVEFNFTNSGNGLLKIKEVNACCGVTASKLKKKKYAPGKGGTLKFEYTSGKYLGSETKRLHVYSNDKSKPNIALTIKAKVVVKIDWEPKSFKLVLEADKTTCPKITINSLDDQPFSITAFKSTLNCITADVDTSVKATKFVLEPKVDAEKIKENMRGYIHIGLDHPEWHEVAISFYVQPMFTINPPQIVLLNTEPQKPIQISIRIINNFGKDFEVGTLSSQNNLIKVSGQKKTENGYQLDLEITPPAPKGEEQIFTDTFLINIKDGPKIEIPCNGFYLIDE